MVLSMLLLISAELVKEIQVTVALWSFNTIDAAFSCSSPLDCQLPNTKKAKKRDNREKEKRNKKIEWPASRAHGLGTSQFCVCCPSNAGIFHKSNCCHCRI